MALHIDYLSIRTIVCIMHTSKQQKSISTLLSYKDTTCTRSVFHLCWDL
uniref:Uncharacterized protein n=1 Tax=Triticum urartu TaxID=4572 RepID=A0A8R7P1E2_TRIUA